MTSLTNAQGRVSAQSTENGCTMSVDLPAPPERVFHALASAEITSWWVRPGVFDTREWSGDVRVGGRWRAAGMMRGEPYAIAGQFREVDAPRRLVHTWDSAGTPEAPSVVTYELQPTPTGTRLTLRQSGFRSKDLCDRFAIAWETSLERLAGNLGASPGDV